jgi:hypothetical protein
MHPQYVLFSIILITYAIGGGFFIKGLLETEPHKKIKLSLYGFSFMLLGFLGNHFLGG